MPTYTPNHSNFPSLTNDHAANAPSYFHADDEMFKSPFSEALTCAFFITALRGNSPLAKGDGGRGKVILSSLNFLSALPDILPPDP